MGGILVGAGRARRGGPRPERARWALELNAGDIVACYYATIGEADRAMDLLERNDVMPGIANRAWVEHDPDLDPVRELPRFRAFVTTLSRTL
jgi:hypothetical protein